MTLVCINAAMSEVRKANYRRRLDRVLRERTSINPLYSLRAFARDIGVSPSQLSLILNGKRGISTALAKKIAVRLRLTEEEQHTFVTEVQSLHARNKVIKEAAQSELAKFETSQNATFLSVDAFSVIANWYHLAIVEALKLRTKLKLEDHTKQVQWLSQRLGVPEFEIEEATGRLVRLELIELRNGVYCAVKDTIFTGDQVPSEAVRSFHKQVIQRAFQSVEGQSQSDRYLRSSMVPIAKSDLPAIREKIKRFHELLIRDYGNNENADSVYAFSTQGFGIFTEEQKHEEI